MEQKITPIKEPLNLNMKYSPEGKDFIRETYHTQDLGDGEEALKQGALKKTQSLPETPVERSLAEKEFIEEMYHSEIEAEQEINTDEKIDTEALAKRITALIEEQAKFAKEAKISPIESDTTRVIAARQTLRTVARDIMDRKIEAIAEACEVYESQADSANPNKLLAISALRKKVDIRDLLEQLPTEENKIEVMLAYIDELEKQRGDLFSLADTMRDPEAAFTAKAAGKSFFFSSREIETIITAIRKRTIELVKRDGGKRLIAKRHEEFINQRNQEQAQGMYKYNAARRWMNRRKRGAFGRDREKEGLVSLFQPEALQNWRKLLREQEESLEAREGRLYDEYKKSKDKDKFFEELSRSIPRGKAGFLRARFEEIAKEEKELGVRKYWEKVYARKIGGKIAELNHALSEKEGLNALVLRSRDTHARLMGRDAGFLLTSKIRERMQQILLRAEEIFSLNKESKERILKIGDTSSESSSAETMTPMGTEEEKNPLRAPLSEIIAAKLDATLIAKVVENIMFRKLHSTKTWQRLSAEEQREKNTEVRKDIDAMKVLIHTSRTLEQGLEAALKQKLINRFTLLNIKKELQKAGLIA